MPGLSRKRKERLKVVEVPGSLDGLMAGYQGKNISVKCLDLRFVEC